MTDEPKSSFPRRAQIWLRNSLVAGTVAVVPLVVVWWVVDRLILSMDGVLAVMPANWRGATWTPPWADLAIPVLQTPGLGFFLSGVLLALVGSAARGLVGRRLVAWVTSPINKIPVVGTIYTATRQLLEAVFSSQAQNFQRVVLVEWPRKDAYVLGFVTASGWSGASEAAGRQLVSVFIPTTPNPTSGFFMMFPEADVRPLPMTVEEAFKAIMSSGIAMPENRAVMEAPAIQNMTVEIEPITLEPGDS